MTACSVSFGYGKLTIEPQKMLGEEFKSEPVHINFGFEVKEHLGQAFLHSSAVAQVQPIGIATEHQWKTFEMKNALGWQMMEKASVEIGHKQMKDLVSKETSQMVFANLSTDIW
jgi:hypothetical protein